MAIELVDIGILILFTLIGGIISSKLKQPAVIGLIIMGAIIGPNLLGLIHDLEMIDQIIEFAAILSLFMIGMEFSLKKIMKIGLSPILATIFKVGIIFFTVFVTVVVLGYDLTSAVFAGIALSFSSTMIITSILKQRNLLHRKEVPMVIAILIIEDVFAIGALTFFSSARAGGELALLGGIQSIFIGLTVMVMLYLILSKTAENAVKWIQKHTGDETVIFIALTLCLGFAYLAGKLNLSPSAGAFFAGSVVSNFKHSKVFEHSLKPISFILISFFFISMGTLVDFSAILKDIWAILVICVVLILGLLIALGIVGRMFSGFSRESGTFMAISMLPPGVFSLLIAREGAKLGTELSLLGLVSATIIIMSLLLNVVMTHRNSILSIGPLFPSFEKGISTVTQFLSKMLSELEIESAHTKEIKRRSKNSFLMLFVLMLALVGLRWILEHLVGVIPIGYVYALFGLGVLLTIYQIYKVSREMKKVHQNIIKMMSDLEGGSEVKRIKKATQSLMLTIISLSTGIFVPFFLYFLNVPFVLMILISSGVILVGCISLYVSYTLINRLTFQYKYAIKSYRKIRWDVDPEIAD